MAKLDTREAVIEIKMAKIFNSSRAALSSIIRRHVKEVAEMSPAERKKLLVEMGQPETCYIDVLKEISIYKHEMRIKGN